MDQTLFWSLGEDQVNQAGCFPSVPVPLKLLRWLSCPKRIDLLTFGFSDFDPFLVMAYKVITCYFWVSKGQLSQAKLGKGVEKVRCLGSPRFKVIATPWLLLDIRPGNNRENSVFVPECMDVAPSLKICLRGFRDGVLVGAGSFR